MQDPIALNFSNQRTANAIRVRRAGDLSAALLALDIDFPRPTLVIIGGASKISEEEFARLRHLFLEVLTPQKPNTPNTVIDGGTDAVCWVCLVVVLEEIMGTFPLIGVAAIGTVALPNLDSWHPANEGAPLESHHSHFVLVPGSEWGKESPWIAQLATELAKDQPSVTILINGGEITWEDAAQSVKAKRRVIVIEGSGRTADIIALALHGEVVTDKRASKLVTSGLLQAINPNESFTELKDTLTRIFSAGGQTK